MAVDNILKLKADSIVCMQTGLKMGCIILFKPEPETLELLNDGLPRDKYGGVELIDRHTSFEWDTHVSEKPVKIIDVISEPAKPHAWIINVQYW